MTDRLERARQWVQHTLGVQSVDLQPASSDASFRRYFRIADKNTSLILMDAPPEREDCRPYLEVSALLEKAGVHVPTIHAQSVESGFLLLEDLGQSAYLDELHGENVAPLYRDAIEALLAMQRGVPVSAVPAYDNSLVMRELALFAEWFLSKHLGIDIRGNTANVLHNSFAVLSKRFEAQARVFVHRDYHSRNLMRTPERNPGILDFQDAVGGPAVYDVISLLRDVYLEWPEERVQEWLLDYHREALSRGVPVASDVGEFLRDADFVAAQRHLKIAGIFCRLFHRDGKSAYLQDIPLTLRYLIDECRRLPELADLGEMLQNLDVMAMLQTRNRKALGAAARQAP